MSDLQDLYQEMVMDHNNRPRNFRKVEDADRSLEGYNPLCGDRYTVYLKLDDGCITDIGFQGSGCAISRSSASLMTESVKGKTKVEAEEIFEAFRQMTTRGPEADFDADKLGDLEILSGVANFPIRIKCATLVWHTLHAALEGHDDAVSTE